MLIPIDLKLISSLGCLLKTTLERWFPILIFLSYQPHAKITAALPYQFSRFSGRQRTSHIASGGYFLLQVQTSQANPFLPTLRRMPETKLFSLLKQEQYMPLQPTEPRYYRSPPATIRLLGHPLYTTGTATIRT